MKTALITGAGGFIGHHVVEWLLEKTDWQIIGTDSWQYTHRGENLRVAHLQDYINQDRLVLHKLDLTLPISDVRYNMVCQNHTIDYVLNFASQSHVSRSILNPCDIWTNNTQLILNVLEFVRLIKPEKFVHISTDEVYGDIGWDGENKKEWDCILPSNVYSASKSAQEALCISYWRTYGVPLIIINLSNTIGERQDKEKFLPKVFQAIFNNAYVDIHSDLSGRILERCWIDVKNVAAASQFITTNVIPKKCIKSTDKPTRIHVAGKDTLDVLNLANRIATKLNRSLKYKIVKKDITRPGGDNKYGLNCDLLYTLGWRPTYQFDSTLNRITEWMCNNPEWV